MTKKKYDAATAVDGAAVKLRGHGMVRVGRIELSNDHTFSIVIELAEAAHWEKAIYGFVVGDKIQRIGSSKAKLEIRFKRWTDDVTASLRGKHDPTPAQEAEGWRDCLRKHGPGEVYARIGHCVTTPVGTFPAYKDEEAVLIERYNPPFCLR
jgi:hypothetical protein